MRTQRTPKDVTDIAGLQTTTALSVASLMAVGFSVWACGHLDHQKTATRFGALGVALTGLSGLVVLWNTIGGGPVHVIAKYMGCYQLLHQGSSAHGEASTQPKRWGP
jgi:hypothetical protein